MSSPFLARLMVTAVATGQGVTPLFIDLNRTHATNPLWTGHARFHVVEQSFVFLSAAVVEVAMLWGIAPGTRLLFYLATLLTALPMCAFIVATFTRSVYGGTLHDTNGVRPARVRIGDHVSEVDMNIVLILVGAVVLLTALLIF